ncbi:hydrogenase maturation protease [Bacillus sp. H-16]|uniref:hydrogenase maturation protease n=1 Tax=Alteribacter salitolerans TaxID=2912333 RepID=UPI0019669C0E|nr:hydrogenase maturation protease [Alteribacter salitolerans]MBM7096739.1 hydrogenase maturation protease [Alteribacter salitolerans]
MGKTIVLGIGNQLMMDDGIGIYVVEELMERRQISSEEYAVGESDIECCLSIVERADRVIVIDAILGGKKPGEITVYSLLELGAMETIPVSPHNLHLFHVLQQIGKNTVVIGIEPERLAFNIGLSDCLNKQRKEIIDEVEKILKELVLEE